MGVAIKTRKPQAVDTVLYLAVLPEYRTECIRILRTSLGGSLEIYISDAHLDQSVRSGIPFEFYVQIPMIRIFGRRAFVQYGHLFRALIADTTIVDLNPRSVSAWIILTIRAFFKKRSLVWGHIHPRLGSGSSTAFLRRTMRKLATGTISYTYSDADDATREMRNSAVWVAPNSLYLEKDIFANPNTVDRNAVLYVGRFETPKKVNLLIAGFAKAAESFPEIRLTLIGGGSEEAKLREMVGKFDIEDRVDFLGWINDVDTLRRHYDSAFCSASPGFAGLGLTQSLGFGVPMIVARDENHSPEIELESTGGVRYFGSNSPMDLARAIETQWKQRTVVPNSKLSNYVQTKYSAEAMARGLINAINNNSSYTPEEG